MHRAIVVGDHDTGMLTAHDMLRGMFNPKDGVVHHFTVKVAAIHHVKECK